uniref:Uncharacterized protein n=1 Tax=Stomoxys calcitrans TaxID=35570 RepID=A0A1I8PC59_STOCA
MPLCYKWNGKPQYYPATNHQQQQLLHQTTLPTSACNRHKEVGFLIDGDIGHRDENGKQQQYHQQSNLRQEYQPQQQSQQYQNIGNKSKWLPGQSNQSHHAASSQEIDDYRQNPPTSIQRTDSHHFQRAHASRPQTPQHQQQQQQQQAYCSKHGGDSMADHSATNDVVLEPGCYVAKKTYITPFDIPSPPPQPVLNDHKRFASGQYAGKTSFSGAAAASNAPGPPTSLPLNNSNMKSFCQCEHNARSKTSINSNAPAIHSNHNHYQQQQQQRQHIAAMTALGNNTTAAAAGATAVTTSLQQQHSHNHHHNRHYPEDAVVTSRTSSLKLTNPQATPHHQQQHHHHHQQQPQYRKIDVFAALDDDDNDTSPSIK